MWPQQSQCVFPPQVTQTLQWAVRSWTDLESSIVSVERLTHYAQTPKEVTGGSGALGPGWLLRSQAAPSLVLEQREALLLCYQGKLPVGTGTVRDP